MVRFENGAVLRLEASWAGYSIAEERLQLLGRQGGAEVALSHRDEVQRLRLFTDWHDQPVEITPGPGQPSMPAYARQIEDFVASILQDREPLATPQQGLLVTKIIEGIYRSAETRREVLFE
jgi:predicted dehydrogenase